MLSQRIRSRVYCANEGREDFVTKTHLSFRSCFRGKKSAYSTWVNIKGGNRLFLCCRKFPLFSESF